MLTLCNSFVQIIHDATRRGSARRKFCTRMKLGHTEEENGTESSDDY
jgi:hypothetical protein